MKKKVFLQFLGVAFLGGLLSVVTLRAIEGFTADKDSQQSRIGFFDNTGLPVHFANYLPNLASTDLDFTFAAEMTVHSVVHIRTEYQRKSSVYDDFFGHLDPFRDFFFRSPPRQRSQHPIVATGSGVIISPDGYIVTNNHVVQEADFIEVTLNNNDSYTAVIIGTDPTTDLALLKIEAPMKLPHVQFGDSDSVRVGEWVLAVGNPFNLNSTVTAGIVSAKARNINILGRQDAIESFIQTDAAVNRGNSGGALVNTKGELIGINAAIASNTGSFTGYSFAIPSNIVRKVAEDLLEYGQVQRAFLGVEIVDMSRRLAEEKNIERIPGVFVAGLRDDGAAKKAGIREGDVITEIEGKRISTTAALLEVVGTKRPGETVAINLVRNGREKEIDVRLRNRFGNYDIIEKEKETIVNVLGASFENVSKEELARLNIRHGVRVTDIEQGQLRRSGIRDGFIITHIDKKPIRSVEDIFNVLHSKKGGVLVEGVYPNGMRAYYGFGL